MTSLSDDNLIGNYIASLSTEKGYSAHTCRAYGHDLVEFFEFMNNDQGKVIGPEQVDGLMIRKYLGYLYKKNARSTVARLATSISPV